MLPFKDEAEGLRLRSDVDAAWRTSGHRNISKMPPLARGIEAGMVFVNTQNVRDLRQPFGGVKSLRHRA
ncbi:aldehyde dehydrogenase family protein [Shigella flexneri]